MMFKKILLPKNTVAGYVLCVGVLPNDDDGAG